jgi:hypothetical protein
MPTSFSSRSITWPEHTPSGMTHQCADDDADASLLRSISVSLDIAKHFSASAKVHQKVRTVRASEKSSAHGSMVALKWLYLILDICCTRLLWLL